jgi:putative nucleotidyltransferase with HDIG domain
MIVFLSSTSLLSGVMSLSLGRPFRQIWREEFRWLWSYYLAFGVSAFGMILGYNYAGLFGVLAIVVPVLALRFSQIQYIEHTKTMVNQLRSNNVELEKQKEEISALNEELLQSLATIVDMRDPFTLGHSKHVARYAEMIAREIGLPPERVELIRKAGLLHDIGKLGIPEVILFKPGSLTKEEYQVIKKHSTLGAEIVEACHALHPLIPAIRHHHERYDGLGYPEGLLGQAIPLEARIIGLADSLEAMASDRPYRKGLEPREIVEEITKNVGTQFDPNVAATFLRILRREGESLIVNSGRILARDEPIRVEAFPHLLG